MSNLQVNPDVARQILADAAAKGEPVEAYLKRIIGNSPVEEDPRILAMRAAISDEMFLADLSETMDEFRHVDLE